MGGQGDSRLSTKSGRFKCKRSGAVLLCNFQEFFNCLSLEFAQKLVALSIEGEPKGRHYSRVAGGFERSVELDGVGLGFQKLSEVSDQGIFRSKGDWFHDL